MIDFKTIESRIITTMCVLCLFSIVSCVLVLVIEVKQADKIIYTQELAYNYSDLGPNSTENVVIDSLNAKNLSFIIPDHYLDILKHNYSRISLESIIKDLNTNNITWSARLLQSQRLFKDNNLSSSLVSAPFAYGLTENQCSKVFAASNFRSCGLKNNPIKLVDGDLIVLDCLDTSGAYALSNEKNEKLGNVRFQAEANRIDEKVTVDMENKEFMIIKCRSGIKQAFLRNKFSDKVSQKSLRNTKKISDILKIPVPDPFGVYLVLKDSVSRHHFYRNMESTIKYLNSRLLNSTQFVMYDFLLNNAHGGTTQSNLLPLFLGKASKDHLELIKGSKGEPWEEVFFDKLQDSIIWKHYEDLGYVTMFGFDTVNNFISDVIGRNIKTDHQVLSFWNAAKYLFNYSEFSSKSKCLGTKNSHRHLFDYVNQYIKNYYGHNKFSYIHTTTAHEDTNTLYKTMDEDLKEFLEEFLDTHEKTKEDFVLVITADHGKNNNQMGLVEGHIENINPVAIIIASQAIINKIGPNAHETLLHNTQRLVGRPDWYVTLKHLASAAYGNISDETYNQFIKESGSQNSVSLLLEKIPDDRLCSDINIEDHFCLTRNYKKIDLNSEIVQKGILEVIKNSLELLNSKIDGKYCKKLYFKELINATKYEIGADPTERAARFKAIFAVESYDYVLLEAEIYAVKSSLYKKIKTYDFLLSTIKVEDKNESDNTSNLMTMQALYINLIEYGDCGDQSLRLGTHHRICICYP